MTAPRCSASKEIAPMTTYSGTSVGTTPAIFGTSPASVAIPPVQGIANGSSNGVYAQSSAATFGALGAVNSATNGYGVYAQANGQFGRGVYAFSSGSTGYGVVGITTGDFATGILGEGNGELADGVRGYGNGSSGNGVYGLGFCGVFGTGPTGVRGVTSNDYGVAVQSDVDGGTGGTAGLFIDGDIAHIGAGAKTFAIDHPLDPENRTLHHACVEAPEQKNIYDGVGAADTHGELAVELPAYFEALNGNFRYQLTALDAPAPDLHVKQRIRDSRFVIAGLTAGQEVAWMVTGIRRDPAAMLRPFEPEREKSPDQRGLFLSPQAFGQGREKSLPRRAAAPPRDLKNP